MTVGLEYGEEGGKDLVQIAYQKGTETGEVVFVFGGPLGKTLGQILYTLEEM